MSSEKEIRIAAPSPLVLASYFNYKADPQRKIKWDEDYSKLFPLINSVIKKGIKIIVFHNCFQDVPNIENCSWVKVTPNMSFTPNVYRYFVYLDFLKQNQSTVSSVFMVDSTDVGMLKNPFNKIKNNILYVGDERSKKVGLSWMEKNQGRHLTIPDYKHIIDNNKDRILINCGIIGGEMSIILKFLEQLTFYHLTYSKDLKTSSDMAIFNYTIWKHFSKIVNHGSHVNTRFKKYETNNNISWWKHK